MIIAVLSKKRSIYSTKRIVEELKKIGLIPLIINPLKCDIVVGEKKLKIYYNKRLLPDIKCVIPRIGSTVSRYALTVLTQMVDMGIPTVSSPKGILMAMNKFHCLQGLTEYGIDVPKSVLIRDPNNLEKAVKTVGNFPVIIKLLRGAQGKGIILAESLESAASTLDTIWSMGKHILIQQYIVESKGTDIRVIVVDGEVVASYKRIAKIGEFRSNLHKGAIGIPVDLNKEQEKIAVKAANALDLKVAGVDMLESSGGLQVIEVNASPGFKGVEKATGINVALKIAKYAQRLINEK